MGFTTIFISGEKVPLWVEHTTLLLEGQLKLWLKLIKVNQNEINQKSIGANLQENTSSFSSRLQFHTGRETIY